TYVNDRAPDDVFRTQGFNESWSTPNITLQSGINNFTVTAYDDFGNTASATITVINPIPSRTVVAGLDTFPFGGGFTGDGGGALNAKIFKPQAVAVDAAGNLFIADTGNFRVRRVTRDGVISTYAGNGTLGSQGDGGLATAAALNEPQGLAIDAA